MNSLKLTQLSKAEMKTTILDFISLLSLILILGSCADSRDPSIRVTEIDGEELMVCNLTKIKPKFFEMPLSNLVKSLNIIQLENKPEALFKDARVTWGRDVIGIAPYGHGDSYKLFKKDGTFLCNIGSRGHGPNEYTNIYADYIDDEKQLVYLAAFPTQTLLCFDFKGNPQKSIPLAYQTSKMRFSIRDSILTVFQIPFKDEIKSIVYQQDLKGNILQELGATPYQVKPDFSHELEQTLNTKAIDYSLSIWAAEKPDSLYHYDPLKNKLIPKFTINFGTNNIPYHAYYELPAYYIVEIIIEMVQSEWGMMGSRRNFILIDKKKHSSQYVKLKNDFWGGIAADIRGDNGIGCFHNGMYIQSIPAIILKEKLDKELKNKHIKNPDKEKELRRLYESINEEGNDYIIYGELKK